MNITPRVSESERVREEARGADARHTCAELGVWTAAMRYLMRATSISEWSWMMDPAARMVLAFFASCVSDVPRKSKAR